MEFLLLPCCFEIHIKINACDLALRLIIIAHCSRKLTDLKLLQYRLCYIFVS
jgi:hypothetical protein